MRLIPAKKALEEYYQEVKHLYPDVTREEFKLICSFPFQFLKEHINSSKFYDIRFTYLGNFVVYPKWGKKMVKARLKRGDYTKKQAEQLIKQFEEYEQAKS